MKPKMKNFYMPPDDLDWMHKIKDEAAAELTVGNVTLSQVLADLIAFAKAQGYHYQNW